MQLQRLHQLLGGYDALDSTRLRGHCAGLRNDDARPVYDYAHIETILDAGNAIHDLLIDEKFDVDDAGDEVGRAVYFLSPF